MSGKAFNLAALSRSKLNAEEYCPSDTESTQRVSDGRIRRRQVPGLACHLVALVKIAQIFRVKIRQIVQHHAIFWSQDQQLFISIAGVLVVFLRV